MSAWSVSHLSESQLCLVSSLQLNLKLGAYHFTTIVPNLGMVRTQSGESFAVADLPGLIEGASQGVGLGTQFLRHIERTRVILHVIDMQLVKDVILMRTTLLSIRNRILQPSSHGTSTDYRGQQDGYA